MRLKPSICAFIACWAMVCSYPVIAQEGKPQPEIEAIGGIRMDPDPILPETEIRSNKLPVTTKETLRDSSQLKVLKPVKSADKANKEEDPLSFNFLYYIIEKFKMSDIIE